MFKIKYGKYKELIIAKAKYFSYMRTHKANVMSMEKDIEKLNKTREGDIRANNANIENIRNNNDYTEEQKIDLIKMEDIDHKRNMENINKEIENIKATITQSENTLKDLKNTIKALQLGAKNKTNSRAYF